MTPYLYFYLRLISTMVNITHAICVSEDLYNNLQNRFDRGELNIHTAIKNGKNLPLHRKPDLTIWDAEGRKVISINAAMELKREKKTAFAISKFAKACVDYNREELKWDYNMDGSIKGAQWGDIYLPVEQFHDYVL